MVSLSSSNDLVPRTRNPNHHSGILAFDRSQTEDRALQCDSTASLIKKYGEDWCSKPRRQGNKLMPLGRDQHAITNINLACNSLKLVQVQGGIKSDQFPVPAAVQRHIKRWCPCLLRMTWSHEQGTSTTTPGFWHSIRSQTEDGKGDASEVHAKIRDKSQVSYQVFCCTKRQK